MREAAAQPLTASDATYLLHSVDAFLFDCDGVIWKGDTLIDGVPQTLDLLRSKGKKLVFVTNNSSKSRRQYATKFHSLGIPVSEVDEIFSSSFAAAMYLKSIEFPRDKKVYVVGGEGILEELQLAGFTGLGGPSVEAPLTVPIKDEGIVTERRKKERKFHPLGIGFPVYSSQQEVATAALLCFFFSSPFPGLDLGQRRYSGEASSVAVLLVGRFFGSAPATTPSIGGHRTFSPSSPIVAANPSSSALPQQPLERVAAPNVALLVS
ncbi:hypothetical protein Cgig2_005388 [Carnegiea gigantea]|uniref:Phosphoglycolate phosphatase n=1 Tax=Carnegiea gigantea TaxID=171969 RepID=A0A9Q1QD12_9CARY|nr:hypothetical protein Cgig2_005388 [Carnegiea gigantea]